MKTWTERMLELKPEKFLELAGIDEELYNLEVTDHYMESNNIAFSSIGSIVETALNNYLDNYEGTKGLYVATYTEYRGDGEYKTNIQFSKYNSTETYIQIYTSRETFVDFANNFIEILQEVFNLPVIDTLKLSCDEVLSLRDVLGSEITNNEVQKMQEYLNDYNFPKKVMKLIYDNVIKGEK